MSVAEDRTTLDELCVNTIRTLSMDAVQKANSGHPGTPMALAPLAYVLYTRVMEHAPSQPDWPDRDRFVLSCGHASMLLYSTLYLTGLRAHARRPQELPPARLADRRPPRVRPRGGHRDHDRAARPGHLHRRRHGARRAHAGRALQPRRPRDRRPLHVRDRLRRRPAGGRRLRGLLARRPPRPRPADRFWDDNHISIEGDTALSFTEDVASRYEAYGWHVQNLGEDIGLDRIEEALANARDVTDRPSLIVVRTHIAPGSPNKQDTHERARRAARRRGDPAHQGGLRLARARSRSSSPTRRSSTSARAIARGEELEADWRERFEAYRGDHPGRGRRVRAHARAQAARGLGRRRAQEGPGRGHDRHPQGLPGRDPVGRRAGAGAGRRLRRPRAVDPDADQGRRQRASAAATAAATCTSASASTAWARSSTASCCTASARSAPASSSSATT